MLDLSRFYDRLDINNRVLVSLSQPMAAVLSTLASTLFDDAGLTDEVETDVDAAIAALSGVGMVGMIAPFMGTAPSGWIPLDGQQVDAVNYPALAAAYPDWVTGGMIRIPDMRDRFLMHGQVPETTGGQAEVTLTVSQMPQHGHGYTSAAISVPEGPDALASGFGASVVPEALTGVAGGGQPHDNMPPYMTARYHIWAG